MTHESSLPARRLDAAGRPHVDYRAVWLLAGPLMANSAVQAALNLTDTWFISRLSTTATAAMAAIYWVVLCVIILIGGIGMATQTFAAQAFGAGRHARAAQAAWSGLFASLAAVPLFVAIGFLGDPLLQVLHVDPEVRRLALAYWWPRLAVAGPLGLFVWALTGFFNGIGRSRLTLLVTLVMGVANVPFNQLFIFDLGLGIAGSAWGTAAAEVLALALALALFLAPSIRRKHRSHLTWRRLAIGRQFAVGLPMGLSTTADLLGLALFQLMLVSLGTVAGAATQIVMMMTSVAYMPGIGIALAGTTLVGQSIGAGDVGWAERVGNAIIRLAMGFMGVIGILLALASPWLLPLFVNARDPLAPAVLSLGRTLIWMAACYQVFDGLNLGSSFSLRGAGDVRVPAVIVAVLSWGLWVPLTHVVTFPPGGGWVTFLPQFGYGAVGGWAVSVGYVVALGVGLWLRWASGAWRRIRLPPP
ncbi:MAG TPA: MATE family efflux transporter [Steroidobacteraceae bacterium]|nr:MATE family efflux transporter [Steroidobacteraceae bacterium]